MAPSKKTLELLSTKQSLGQPSSVSRGVQRVGAFTALPTLIRQLGAGPNRIFENAGLAKNAFDDADNRIPYAAIGRVLEEAAARTKCIHFGLLVGRVWHLSDLGIVGEVVRNSPNVGDALRKLIVHQHINSQSAGPFFREAAGVVDFGIAIYEDGVVGLEQLFDAYMAAGMNVLLELCGPGFTPTEVFIPSAKPRDCTYHRQLLKVTPHFGAEFCALRFSAHWLRKAVDGADPERLRLTERRANLEGAPALLQQVNRALRVLLLNGKNSGDDVARMLAMHRRTLNRRLHEQGTTFQSVLDKVRFEVARQLLSSSNIALDDVAGSLGYAGVSPFMRSFRRWSGMTPGDWRHHFGYRELPLDQSGMHTSTIKQSRTALLASLIHQTTDDGSPRRKQNMRNRDGTRAAQDPN